MTEQRYTVVESVGNAIENVDKYSDLAKHHPSSGQEPNRSYQEIDGQLEEIRNTPDGRTLIKKDFVLLVNGSNQSIRVPAPVAGYVKTSSSYGTVRIFEGQGGKLLGQVLHLKPPFLVSTGDTVAYGQHIGLQDGTGASGTRTYAIHVHAELEQAQFERYIADLTDGTLTPDGSASAPAPAKVHPLNWSHPFRDKENPILQLTKLSRAVAGFYPLGRNGLWHGGVHFDSGTAGVLDQSSVHCLADGEVVAYRIDSKYPTSTHRLVPLQTHEAPYATGFVLVRHRLQAPSVEGLQDAPPSLTFYSLYMHLQDWTTYQTDPQQPRPAFWRQRYRVKADALDPIRKGLNVRSSPNAKSSIVAVLEPGSEVRIANSGNFRQLRAILSGPQQGTLPMGNHGGPGYVWFKSLDSTPAPDVYVVKSSVADPLDLGLNIRKAANKKSEVLAVLPRGAEIEIAGTQGYCKLKAIHEGSPEPALIAAEGGELPGYVWIGDLEASAPPGRYRVKATANDPMRTGANVLSEGKGSSAVLSVLAKGSEVRISGAGKYRKLQALVSGLAEPPLEPGEDGQLPGYIAEAQLEKFAATEPEAQDGVVFLEQPVPIKAGELIGHLGQYQDFGEALPQKKLHLEVFSADKVREFIQQSRDWAKRLPASGKTWLMLAKGTRVIPHQEGFNKQNPPTPAAQGAESAADLLVPKSLLDGLRPENRISLPATATEKACNWYRLDGLLHDANRTLLDGWVLEEVGVTPWNSPWEWVGYDFIVNTETPERNCAALMCALGEVEEDDSDTRLKADLADKGPVRNRLFDLIDPGREAPLTAEAIQAAIALPGLAQSLAQLIIHYESEWYWRPGKWDVLDKLYGDTSSTPNENWREEKQRIQKLSWWSEVADKLGLPMRGAVWHIQAVGLTGKFGVGCVDILIRRIGDVIAKGEGGYESYNTGTKDVLDGKVGYSFYSPAKGTVTEKTINSIIATDELSGNNQNRMFATGKYQTVIRTLRSAKTALGLSGEEKYSEELQERVFAEYLLGKAGGGALERFVRYGKGSADDAQFAASKEWASIASPAGRVISDGRVSDGNLSYYAGSANSASAESTKALRELLSGIESGRGE
ncbi:SH3 domain-containing protein [Pseudomonas sp. PDM22]|uniref:SH3 domain-containing protein n=1 Tax=Pseudomonas sp. PDM22 TaxID=2769287 RepID=UPI0017865130|nr:hypothetical protein [Pseudomonas sp. PDM22]MBD9516108.1 hypothetical protein [Pseudomonas sp. PDM22]